MTTAVRRFSQVYVDIPPSPYSSSLTRGGAKTPSDENMPEDASNLNDGSGSKRKRVDDGAGEPKKKKVKKSEGGGVNGKDKEKEKDINEQYPNGYFHCHQCVQKRDVADGLQCTFRGHNNTQGRRCKLKYCRTCLKNRYGLELDVLKSRGPGTLHGKELLEYVTDVGHVFKCPRCTKMCNCRTCRKAAGLPPTGNLTVTAKRTGADSVAAMLATNKTLTEAEAKQTAPPPLPKPKPQPKPKPAPNNAKASSSKTQVIVELVKSKRKARPAPRPIWTPLPVPSSFSLSHGLTRVHIHDFVLRLAEFFGDVTKAQMDELGEIGGRGWDGEEDDEGGDAGVRVGWISEGCLRGVLLGLLGLCVDSAGIASDKDALRSFKSASLSIRNAGASLNKMWAALADVSDILSLPDPLPAPSSSRNTARVTRNAAAVDISLVTSAQFVRVVERMVDVALGSAGVKEVMDECGSRLADLGRDERERRKEEKERWEAWRKSNTVTKPARDAHALTLASLTHSLSISQSSLSPRFAPLGTDHSGRTYVVTAPSQSERDAALELLAGSNEKATKKRGRSARVEEREGMKRWGWFVAVYGGLPEGAKRGGDEEEDGEEREGKRWWGFYEPDEIRKLAGWIAYTNGLSVKGKGTGKTASQEPAPAPATNGKSTSSSSRATSSPLSSAPHSSSRSSSSKHARDSLTPLSSLESDSDDAHSVLAQRRTATRAELEKLVLALREWADLLEWRISRSEEGERGVLPNVNEKGKGKSGAVQPKSFYG